MLLPIAIGLKSPQVCCNPRNVDNEIFCRTSVTLEKARPCSEVILPGVILEDGLDEVEAVATGLANNSLFQAALAQLGMAGGDAVQASLIANPQVQMYFPSGAKEGQYTIYAPIESYFLRPTRVKIANREYRRIGDQLVQNGLNVTRDIRLAYIDLALVTEQSQLANEAVEIHQGIANLTRDRFNDGDISELETALACRPDYHAARWAVAAASERYHLSRWIFWRTDSVLDVRHGPNYTWTGTGLRFDLPIFNRNQGGILRADWELNGAMHARDAIRDQIYQDVRVACRQLYQAKANLTILESEVLPNLAEAIGIAKKSFADGGTDYLLVLQTTTLYLDARARILDQRAMLRRANAELERSVERS